MKVKKFSAILVVLCLCLSLVSPVQAELLLSTEQKAASLSRVSLISKSGTSGYNLGSVLKRSEAAALVVKLLGRQEMVLANKDAYRFTDYTDVSETQWYAPYVGYCAAEGIMGASNDGRFRPNDPIGEKAFLLIVMTAMGYENGVDFTYGTIYAKAYQIGLVKGDAYKNKTKDTLTFTRGDMVKVLYTALPLRTKGPGKKFMYTLVERGITTLEAAQQEGFLEDKTAAAVSKVEFLQQNQIKVTLTESLQLNQETPVKVYETQNPASVLPASVEIQSGNLVIIKIENQVPFTDYTVEFANCLDTEGNWYPSLMGSFTGYQNPEVKSDFFKISKAEVVNKNSFNLYFTQPVNANSEVPSYYDILDANGVFVKGGTKTLVVKQVSANGNVVSVQLREAVFTKDALYTVKISGDLSSLYGVRLDDGSGDSVRFKGKEDTGEAFKILAVTALSGTQVKVDFSQYVDPFFAQQFVNYLITGSGTANITATKAVVETTGERKGKAVLLTLSSVLDRTRQYNLFINYITDVTKQNALTEVNTAFSGYYPDKTELAVNSVKCIDRGTLQVAFNKPVSATNSVNRDLYSVVSVSYTGFYTYPVKVLQEGAVVKLFFPSDKVLDVNKGYKLIVAGGIQDSMGASLGKNIEFSFTGAGAAPAKPSMAEALIIGKDTVKVRFTREIAELTPNISASNYTMEYVEDGISVPKVPISAIYIDPTTLILKFDSLNFDTKYTLRFKSLKDFSEVYTSTAADGNNSIEVKLGNK